MRGWDIKDSTDDDSGMGKKMANIIGEKALESIVLAEKAKAIDTSMLTYKARSDASLPMSAHPKLRVALCASSVDSPPGWQRQAGQWPQYRHRRHRQWFDQRWHRGRIVFYYVNEYARSFNVVPSFDGTSSALTLA